MAQKYTIERKLPVLPWEEKCLNPTFTISTFKSTIWKMNTYLWKPPGFMPIKFTWLQQTKILMGSQVLALASIPRLSKKGADRNAYLHVFPWKNILQKLLPGGRLLIQPPVWVAATVAWEWRGEWVLYPHSPCARLQVASVSLEGACVHMWSPGFCSSCH